ncbi:GNAT family N-acetyltransferase [Pikeienuella piscinae]|uniref:GNAT family N-acetyltransferase n=1 Tax=Pikeienuella piscinae TaxID=2748098 RepID=A0A7L5C0U1_9RHOB|nr:GNAT family N-acetyltransferase [Pikeienuella piscinae]QIE55764.1 GNAT family N-acetyltransferase [Pikeienuella piscinae]
MGALIRDIDPADLPWVLALNLAHEVELSPLNEGRLAALIDAATYARAAEGGAFLIGFDQSADYDSENFLWHRARREKFLYVDRIAVAATHRRRGLAAALYADLFAFAAERGLERVVAEVNAEPPNPASDAFHARLGFVTVGEARLKAREKTVRYIERVLD